MKQFSKTMAIAMTTFALSGVAFGGGYSALWTKMGIIVQKLGTEEGSTEACRLFEEFQKERDELIEASGANLSFWSKRNLKATRENEKDITHYCKGTKNEKGVIPSREEAHGVAKYVDGIFGWE